MKGDLFINGKDAYETWRVGFEAGAIANLMTPAPMKDYVTNTSRKIHGEKMLTNNARVAGRDVLLMLHIIAGNQDEMLSRFSSFCEELKAGKIEIYDKKYTGNKYKCVYVSCNSYTHGLIGGVAKFVLKVREPDPTNRG